MTRISQRFALLAVAVAALAVATPAAPGYAQPTLSLEFLSPRPGAGMILPETNVILRPGGLVDPSISLGSVLQVNGSISGPRAGRLRLSEDRTTLVWQPDLPFAFSETVTCRLRAGLVTATRGAIPEGEFSFTIAGPEREALRDYPIPRDYGEPAPDLRAGEGPPLAAGMIECSSDTDSLPFDFPIIHADSLGPTARGRIFLSDIFFSIRGPRIPSYLMILENDGTPYFYRHLEGVGLDFKLQEATGQLTYYDTSGACFYAMDASYAVVDTFRCGNGYTTDSHELLLLPNGHAVLMSYDPQPMDLSAVGGRPDAIVIGLVIQELDRDRNVVFQWRSWDHFQVTDMMFHDIERATVDYVHGNSVEVDPEGNFILSSRHMNEVTKISRATGAILWRLGGKNNEFTLVNEPLAFSHQHDVRLLPNGHITMFDNGNYRVPQLSRAVEYELDQTRKTATKVWEYRLTPDVFGVAFGSARRLPNGNTLIGWGATTPTLTEVTPQGTEVSRVTFEPGVASYRAFRFEWPPVRAATVVLEPRVLARGSRAPWIQAMIRADFSSFDIAAVDVSSIRINGTVAPLGDAMANGGVLVARFARASLEPLLASGSNRLEVSGSLMNGATFRGFAELTVFTPGERPGTAAMRLVSPPGAVPVVVSLSPRTPAPNPVVRGRTVSIFDVQGRLIKRWRTKPGAGRRASWDGRKANGRPVATGVYFVQADGSAAGQALKVAIIR